MRLPAAAIGREEQLGDEAQRQRRSTTCSSALTSSVEAVVGTPSASPGATAKARPSESTTLAIDGTDRPANGGTRASHATIRTDASR